jgi:DNA-binding CsgD family transcriptional regulator
MPGPDGPPVPGRPASCEAAAPALLDRCPLGMLLLSVLGEVVRANAVAWSAIAAGSDGLALDGGLVSPADPARAGAWRDALVRAAGGATTMVRPTVGPAVVLSPWEADGGATLVLCTLPLHPSAAGPTLRAYGRLHRLTESELDVLARLAAGQAPKAIARRRGATEDTVRSQLKSVLAKTGRHGLRELVADVLRSAPAPAPRLE